MTVKSCALASRSAAATVAAVMVLMVALSGCSLVGGVTATTIVPEHLSVGATPTLTVDTFNGVVSVIAGGEGSFDVKITKRGSGGDQAAAEQDLAKIEATVTQEGERITVTARRTDGQRLFGNSGADVEVVIPTGASMDLTTSNARVDVTNLLGTIVVHTSNGGVTIRKGTDVNVQTSNASITVTGSEGTLTLASSNGSIDVVDVEDVVVMATSSNASIAFSGSLAAGDHRLATSNGQIRLSLPGNAAFTMDASTSNANITSEFPLTLTGGTLNGSVGDDPQAHITLETSNAQLSVLKQAP
ncbi:MAG: DUF4097 family beta strand repeat-containing protein [Candidatus Limnocylindrales bacterium]